jgi:hypothetical protein
MLPLLYDEKQRIKALFPEIFKYVNKEITIYFKANKMDELIIYCEEMKVKYDDIISIIGDKSYVETYIDSYMQNVRGKKSTLKLIKPIKNRLKMVKKIKKKYPDVSEFIKVFINNYISLGLLCDFDALPSPLVYDSVETYIRNVYLRYHRISKRLKQLNYNESKFNKLPKSLKQSYYFYIEHGLDGYYTSSKDIAKGINCIE